MAAWSEADLERARIRALVVARMNRLRERMQQAADDSDERHAWDVAVAALRGLLAEIDRGDTVQALRGRSKES